MSSVCFTAHIHFHTRTPLQSLSEPRPVMFRPNGFSTVNFKGQCIRSVSYYTLLSGFQLPWPPSDCLNVLTPFKSNKPFVMCLIITLGAFQSTVSAYQKRSTRRVFLRREQINLSPGCTFVVCESVKPVQARFRQTLLYYT